MQTRPSPPPPGYLVHQQGGTSGPFDLGFIEAMVLAGVYAAGVRIQKEGESRIFPISDIFKAPAALQFAPAAPNVPQSTRSVPDGGMPTPVRRSGPQAPRATVALAWSVSIVGIGFFIWIALDISQHSARPASSPSATASTSTGSYSPSSTYTAPPASSPRSTYTTPTPPPLYIPPLTPVYTPPAPVYTPPVTSTPPSYTSSYSPGTSSSTRLRPSTTQDSSSTLYRDAQGNTYRVPNSAYYGLLLQKGEIERESIELDQLESQIDRLANQLDLEKITLDRTSRYALSRYNAKVDQLNQLNSEAKLKVLSHNRKVNAFNTELARVGTLVR